MEPQNFIFRLKSETYSIWSSDGSAAFLPPHHLIAAFAFLHACICVLLCHQVSVIAYADLIKPDCFPTCLHMCWLILFNFDLISPIAAHTHTWLKAVVVVGVTQLLKRRNRLCEIGLLLNHHSLLSLSIIYGNVSIEPSWLTTANHKLNVLTSLKLLMKNKHKHKQMMAWNYLQSLTANTPHEASVCVCVCIISNRNLIIHMVCLC